MELGGADGSARFTSDPQSSIQVEILADILADILTNIQAVIQGGSGLGNGGIPKAPPIIEADI